MGQDIRTYQKTERREKVIKEDFSSKQILLCIFIGEKKFGGISKRMLETDSAVF
jgi:hypothetical protein